MTTDKPLKIFRSSAGSGKTYTLVKEYISILLNSKDPLLFKKILAITFTNKAANEMKDRVLETLKELSIGTQTPLFEDYLKVVPIKPSEIAHRSQTIFDNIIHHYGEFNILTIDKFIHRIIRSFTRELGLAMNFELESDVNLFVAKSIDLLLSEVGTDKDLTKYLVQFSEQLIDNSETGDVEKELNKLSQILQKEDGKKALEELKEVDLSYFIKIQKEIKDKISNLKKEIETLSQQTIDLIEGQGLDIYNLAGGKNGFGKMYHAFVNNQIDTVNVSETMVKKIAEDNWYSKSAKAFIKSGIDAIKPVLIQSTVKLLELHDEYMTQRTFDKNFIGFSLLNSINKVLLSIKQESNIVFLNDFNEIISNVVQNEPAPFIYEKIGNRYSYFLIDEFQDTSKLQWNNLVPLVYDSLSSGNKNLIVGDAKQAIYRWRGGEVNQFIDLPAIKGEFFDLYAINQTFNNSGIVQNLEDNWRSYKNIIEFNNWLFSSLASKSDSETLKRIYEGVNQNVKKSKDGYVSYQLLEGTKAEMKDEKLELTIQYIEECLADGFSYSDIAILTKTNKDGKLIASYLSDRNIPVVSSDSIVLGSSSAVNFIVSFFETVLNAKNEHAILKCLQFLEKETHLSQVHEKWRVPNPEKEHCSVSINFDAFLAEKYPAYNASYFDSLNLYDKTIYLYETFSLNRFDSYLDQLLNTIQNYTKRNTSSLQEFTDYFEDNKGRIPVNIGGNTEAVQITTIHKSKGLQYPVVIMPFADWVNKNNQFVNYTWINTEGLVEYEIPKYIAPISKKALGQYKLESVFEKETEDITLDNINLFYVAFTRPEKRMYVVASEKVTKDVYGQIVAEIVAHENYNKDKKKLVFGIREKEEEKEIIIEETTYEGPKVKTWRNNLALSLDRNALEIELTELDEREYGNAVHYIWANFNHPSELNAAIDKAITRGILPEKFKEKVRTAIQNCLALEDVQRWYQLENSEVLNENAIVAETGQSYRPDKIILTPSQVIVIDYKTGAERKIHKKQIKEYGELLEKLGYEKPSLFLLYMKDKKVVSC